MGFLDGLKKSLGFGRKQEQNAAERAAQAARVAREAADARAVAGAPKGHPGPVGIDASLDDGLQPEAEAVTPAPTTASADAAAAEAAAADALQQAAAREAAAQHAAVQRASAEHAAAAQQAAAAAGQATAQQATAAAAAQAAAQQAAAEPASATEVVVESGDTISSIALRLGVDVNALIAANADTVPNPDNIQPGQVLRLP